jgi:hypothetical protein
VSNDTATEADRYQVLTKRFDERANSLRKQAKFLFRLIIVAPVAGAVAFLLANDITSFTLRPQTAEAQYAAAAEALKQNAEEEKTIARRIREITDTSSLTKPLEDNEDEVLKELSAFQADLISRCDNVTSNTEKQFFHPRMDADFRGIVISDINYYRSLSDYLSPMRNARCRIDEVEFDTVGREISFSSK